MFVAFIIITLYLSGKLQKLIRPSDFLTVISLIITVLSGVVGDYFAAKLKYPSMLGMLISGMLVRNVFPFLVVDIPHTWTSILWTLSLTAVVARAGLSLKLNVLRENATSVFLVGVVPILFEAVWLSKFSRLLFLLPKAWSYLLAFGVASISPGVVVPLILSLQENPAWIGSRLPSMMIASVSIDVLVATIGYGISLKSVFRDSSDQNHSFLLIALEDLALGLILGLAFGVIAFLLKYVRSYKIVSFSFMFLLSALAMGWVYFFIISCLRMKRMQRWVLLAFPSSFPGLPQLIHGKMKIFQQLIIGSRLCGIISNYFCSQLLDHRFLLAVYRCISFFNALV